MIKPKEAIWLTTVFLIHFLHMPTMLAPVPSSLFDKTLHHRTVLKLSALLFQFLSAEQWVLVRLLQLYNIKGCLQNATIASNPLWMPSSLARVQIFAPFSVRVFYFRRDILPPHIFCSCEWLSRDTYRPGLSGSPSAACFCMTALPVYPVAAYEVLWLQQLGTGNPVRNCLCCGPVSTI